MGGFDLGVSTASGSNLVFEYLLERELGFVTAEVLQPISALINRRVIRSMFEDGLQRQDTLIDDLAKLGLNPLQFTADLVRHLGSLARR